RHAALRALLLFPTRRSSDLIPWHAENRCSRGGWQRRSVTVRTAVVCPCTPLLVPQISGSRPDMSRLRGLCVDAVESMLAGDIDQDRKSTRLNSSHVSISYAV